MFRQSLADDEGMLFVYPFLDNHRIWMKNTLIPLTVIWLDEEATIIANKLLPPCREKVCPVYSAPSKSKYIIELNEDQYPLYKTGDQLPELKAILSGLSTFLQVQPDDRKQAYQGHRNNTQINHLPAE